MFSGGGAEGFNLTHVRIFVRPIGAVSLAVTQQHERHACAAVGAPELVTPTAAVQRCGCVDSTVVAAV